jgi:large subunit ribosomal protein L4
MKLTTYTKTGNKSKTPILGSEAVFNAEVNQELLAQGVRVYLTNQRQGTSKTQSRSAVTRTKKKWYKQKGTGNARHGSRNAPIFVGGGVAHGPNGNSNWKLKMTRRLKSQALISALSTQKDNIVVCDGFAELSGKTKQAAELLAKIVDKKDKVLVVLAESNTQTFKSLRNLEKILMTKSDRLNVYEASLADKIIFSSDAVKKLEERLAKYIGVAKKDSKKVNPK